MICHRCLLRVARSNGSAPLRRVFSSAGAQRAEVTAQTATATNPRPNDVPAATSTSAAQPFSAPLTPAPESETPGAQGRRSRRTVKSSVPAGTVMKGINFMKNKLDPVALEDSEYPDWLWTVLDSREDSASGAVNPEDDLFSKSKKQRRAAAKNLRKQQLLNPDLLVPKVPLAEQTLDLPGGSSTAEEVEEADAARAELTKAMRVKRRKDIKENNYLRSMS